MTKLRSKQLFFFNTLILVLLAVLPVNGTESALNNNYFLSVRLDYLAHFAVYMPWMLLLRLYSGVKPARISRFAGLILAGLAFAFLNEFVQYYLPYRAFNINDLAANGIGVLLGTVFFFLPDHFYRRFGVAVR